MTKLQEYETATISKEKSIRLLWLGRYVERAYFTLHLLRKCHDLMIDENEHAYIDFCFKMGIENKYESAHDFMSRYLYDSDISESVFSMLINANDNGIVLREEIKSETLSYIQMAMSHIKACSLKKCDINELQNITDYLLAFWGSVDVRIGNSSMRNVIKAGRFIESVDLHIRFNYSFDRVSRLMMPLNDIVAKEKYIFNDEIASQFSMHADESCYHDLKTLQFVNQLFYA